jgi:hypothetical protein
VREKIRSGEIRRVNPLEVGSGKFANNNERNARSAGRGRIGMVHLIEAGRRVGSTYLHWCDKFSRI